MGFACIGSDEHGLLREASSWAIPRPLNEPGNDGDFKFNEAYAAWLGSGELKNRSHATCVILITAWIFQGGRYESTCDQETWRRSYRALGDFPEKPGIHSPADGRYPRHCRHREYAHYVASKLFRKLLSQSVLIGSTRKCFYPEVTPVTSRCVMWNQVRPAAR
jgi:hypothetical protein